jgi:hypothetical protein
VLIDGTRVEIVRGAEQPARVRVPAVCEALLASCFVHVLLRERLPQNLLREINGRNRSETSGLHHNERLNYESRNAKLSLRYSGAVRPRQECLLSAGAKYRNGTQLLHSDERCWPIESDLIMVSCHETAYVILSRA